MTIPKCLEWAHEITERAMRAGPCLAVDATAGNGHDTLHLATLAGPDGMVWGFDVQDEAIENTRILLAEHDAEKTVTLIKACHTEMKKHIPDTYTGKISAVMFNLGYLPAGDRSVITTPSTTITALESALDLIRVGGVVTVLMYPGHNKDEAQEVIMWAAGLDQKRTEALWYRFPNQKNSAPFLLCLERRS